MGLLNTWALEYALAEAEVQFCCRGMSDADKRKL